MKYGASLRVHSIPAWAHHNIDYDEIKAFIKENTTPGNGTAVSIPGTGDAQVREVEDALFDILFQQHKRINLFVWSKTGEIRRRLDHLAKQTKELRYKEHNTQARVTAKRLERYGRLESDVLKAGEELRSLSRFITAQQTAFRKLIKKYKKWSRSSGLELSFNKEILSDSTSFTRVDLEPMLAGWEETLDAVRVLYEERMSSSSAMTQNMESRPRNPGLQAALARIQDALRCGSQARFDTAFATLPLGSGGQNAVYWVHPENVVELQVLLLQHTRSHAVRRASTTTTPVGTLSRHNSFATSSPSRRNSCGHDQDTGLLIVDDQDRLVREQSSTTLDAKESTVGVRLQNATVSARWTQEDEAIIAARLGEEGDDLTEVAVKRKHLAVALDPLSTVPAHKASVSSSDTVATKQIEELRSWFGRNGQFRPLATIACSRQRFTDIAADSGGFLLATLDKSISMRQSSLADLDCIDTTSSNTAATFPFAVLRIRQEGSHANNLVQVLNGSHLVERVRGFSLEYHAVWHCCQPGTVIPPFWIPLLDKDIRKVPKPTAKHDATLGNSGFASQSTTPNISASCTSDSGNGETTAVEDHPSTSRIAIADQLQTPPLSSFRKKRTRSYARGYAVQAPKQNYWSEYDHPSDSDEDGAYVIFVDPNAESSFTQTWRKLVEMFNGEGGPGKQSLLRNGDSAETSSSSDEESHVSRRSRTRHSYGTVTTNATGLDGTTSADDEKSFWLPPLTMTCLGASIAILIVGYLLAMTGRKKQAREVDAGIIFAVVSSLLFAMSGVASLFRLGKSSVWPARLIALAVLAIDAVASGALLAWILS